jgi:hypothetical protein
MVAPLKGNQAVATLTGHPAMVAVLKGQQVVANVTDQFVDARGTLHTLPGHEVDVPSQVRGW